jgi:hypothetical protein
MVLPLTEQFELLVLDKHFMVRMGGGWWRWRSWEVGRAMMDVIGRSQTQLRIILA